MLHPDIQAYGKGAISNSGRMMLPYRNGTADIIDINDRLDFIFIWSCVVLTNATPIYLTTGRIDTKSSLDEHYGICRAI